MLGQGLAHGVVPVLGVTVVLPPVASQQTAQSVLRVIDLLSLGGGEVTRVAAHGPILAGPAWRAERTCPSAGRGHGAQACRVR